MSDELTREHLETSKQRAIVYREWSYFAMAALFCGMLIWALWSWKQTNNMVGATQAKINGVIDRLGSKLDAVDVMELNSLIASGKVTVGELQLTEKELTKLLADTRQSISKISDSITSRVDSLQANLDSLKSVTDETAIAVRDITKASTVLMDRYGLTAEEATKAITTASEKTGKSLDELAKQIGDPRWATAADNLVATSTEATLTLKDIHQKTNETLAEMPGIAKDIHGTTTNIRKFSKVTIISSIISRLAASFIPGVLN